MQSKRLRKAIAFATDVLSLLQAIAIVGGIAFSPVIFVFGFFAPGDFGIRLMLLAILIWAVSIRNMDKWGKS